MSSKLAMAWLVKITARAERDFSNLFEEISAAESATERRWYSGLRRAVLSLEKLPHRCPVTRKRGQVRQLLYGHKPHIYLVLFRILEKQRQVDVLHIRHGARLRFTASDIEEP